MTKIFDELEVKADLDFEPLDKENTYLKVNIISDDANLLIGYHGDTLNSLQHIVNVILFNKFGEHGGVLLDVEGYRKEREKKLLSIAENAVSKAKFLDKSIALYPMNSYERKIVHEYVSSQEGVTSESEGEGAGRRVIITPTGEVANTNKSVDDGFVESSSDANDNGGDDYDNSNGSDSVGDIDMGEDFNYSES